MTLNPARRHFLRTVAAKAAVAGNADEMPPATASAYELMLRQLAEHRRELKKIQSVERKIEAKRGYLPAYADWIAGTLDARRGTQDDVLVTVLIWTLDTNNLPAALPLARYALQHGLTLPDNYQRTLGCVIAEEFAEAAMRLLARDAVKAADRDTLLEVAEITADEDMPDEVRAKLHRAIGYAWREYDFEAALRHLKTALKLNDKVGVKKDIERLEREIKKAAGVPARLHSDGEGSDPD
jgi:hypothetical protein